MLLSNKSNVKARLPIKFPRYVTTEAPSSPLNADGIIGKTQHSADPIRPELGDISLSKESGDPSSVKPEQKSTNDGDTNNLKTELKQSNDEKSSSDNKNYKPESMGDYLLDVKSTYLEYMAVSADDVSNCNDLFEYKCRRYAKNVDISSDLSHITCIEFREAYANYKVMARESASIWNEVREYTIDGLFDIIPDLRPISDRHLVDLERVMKFSTKMNSSAIFQSTTYPSHIKSEFIYGIANGCRDMIYLAGASNSKDTMVITMKRDLVYNASNVKDRDIKRNYVNVVLTRGTEVIEDVTYPVPDDLSITNTSSSIGDIPESHRGMTSESENHFRDDVLGYSINISSKINRSVSNDVANTAIAYKNSDGQNMVNYKGVKTNTNHPFNSEEMMNNIGISSSLISMMNMYDIGLTHDQITEFVNHQHSTFVTYIKNAIRFDVSIDITNIDLKITIVRPSRSESELMESYRKHVNSGYWYPISSLQWSIYLNKSKIQDWKRIITIVSMFNPALNGHVGTVTPFVAVKDKFTFKRYARDHSMLSTSSLYPYTLKTGHIAISWDSFCKEMFVRQFTHDNIPNVIPLFSNSSFKFGTLSNELLNISRENPVLSVFDVDDQDKLMDQLINLSLLWNGLSDKPIKISGFRSRARLSDKPLTRVVSKFVRRMSTIPNVKELVHSVGTLRHLGPSDLLWSSSLRNLKNYVINGIVTDPKPLAIMIVDNKAVKITDHLLSMVYLERSLYIDSATPGVKNVESKILTASRKVRSMLVTSQEAMMCIEYRLEYLDLIIVNGVHNYTIKPEIVSLYNDEIMSIMRCLTTSRSHLSLIRKYNNSISLGWKPKLSRSFSSDQSRYDNIIKLRKSDLSYEFSYDDCLFMMNSGITDVKRPLPISSLTTIKAITDDMYTTKPMMDSLVVEIWNELYPNKYRISTLEDLSDAAETFVRDYESNFPDGVGASESDHIRFVNAFAKSSWIGVQSASSSRSARDSIVKGLSAHNDSRVSGRPEMIELLYDVFNHISENPDVMEMDYHTLLLSSKQSSSSIPGEKRKFRDFLFDHSFDDIMNSLRVDPIDFCFVAGIRLDRRGKMRLIFSMMASIRALDHILNAGSYNLFNHKSGFLRKHTTEGMRMSQMWKRMRSLVSTDKYASVCTDYSAYDAQFALSDYTNLFRALNSHRKNDPRYAESYQMLLNWLNQPKSLVRRGLVVENIIDYVHTLASGLKGTHSYENLWGIATHRDMIRKGIDIRDFIVNGDDQNCLVSRSYLKAYERYMADSKFEISSKKSLMGHTLSVWSKRWCAIGFAPMFELGTIRSLTETEGKGILEVHDSKVSSNYGAILRVLIVLIRMNKPIKTVEWWARKLCNFGTLKFDYKRVPVSLNEIKINDLDIISKYGTPRGLLSERSKLEAIDLPYNLFRANNTFDMLKKTWQLSRSIDSEPAKIEYYPEGMVLEFKSVHDYAIHDDSNVPYHLKDLISSSRESQTEYTSRQFINCTGCYDGPLNQTFKYNDMISLAHALVQRDKLAWDNM